MNLSSNTLKGKLLMLRIFKKSFYIPYVDGTTYPTVEKAQQAIVEYCESNGHSYTFTSNDEVIIDGIAYDICRGYHFACRGYGIKCREK